MSSSGCLASARRLHGHLAATHLEENLLIGPDPGVRFNLRFWRFLKSVLPAVDWKDNYCFLQTQGYWCRANRKLFDLTGESRFRDLSLEAGKAVLRMQQSEGTWTYPLPERRNLIATLEGNWAALTLLETYAQLGEQRYLQAALRWYEFLQQRIGFQKYRTGLAVNYFDRPRGNVPNNSTNTLYFLYKLAKAAGEEKLREQAGGLIRFLAEVQLPTGELPYIVENEFEPRRDVFLTHLRTERNLSPQTLRAYGADLADFGQHLRERRIDTLEVTPADFKHGLLALPYTFALTPDLSIHKIYNGWWYVGRPSLEELRHDMREMMQACRDDYAYNGPSLASLEGR